MVVAGEASGDAHAAKLVSALRNARPEISFEFFGAAGPKMRDAGVVPIVRSDELSVVGLAEIGRALPMFLRAAKELKKAAEFNKPHIVILVDFPEFNLKLAKWLKKKGFPVAYYISPQLWAWRKYRVSTVKKYVDLMITILPFEKDWYAGHGVHNVEYVGSPLAREVRVSRSRDQFCRDHNLDPANAIVCLLPGSRHKEIARIFPVMLDAASLLARQQPDVQFVVPVNSEADRVDVERIYADASDSPPPMRVRVGETFDALGAADAAAVASGTATLETAIIGTPMVVVYKTSSLNYSLFEPMIDVPHYALINLIAKERLVTELIQHDFTPDRLAVELGSLLEPSRAAVMREKLRSASDKLGHGGASKRAAEAILRLIDSRQAYCGPNDPGASEMLPLQSLF